MGFFDSIKEGITNHFNKKREERERFERMQEQVSNQNVLAFEQQFGENARIANLQLAQQQATGGSGIQKLRGTNTLLQMQSAGAERPGRWSKLKEFTRKNKQRMQENLARTAEKRKVAKQMREDRFSKRTQERNTNKTRSQTRTIGFR